MNISAEKYGIISIGVLLVITAFGNAKIMFAVSALGLLLGLGLLKKSNGHSSVLAATIGFFLTMVIAVFIWLKK